LKFGEHQDQEVLDVVVMAAAAFQEILEHTQKKQFQ
jgi:hypothetical protein